MLLLFDIRIRPAFGNGLFTPGGEFVRKRRLKEFLLTSL